MQFLIFPDQNNLNIPENKIAWKYRFFPDGEAFISVDSPVEENVVVICSLNNPGQKTLPLIFVADKLKATGAKKVHLWAPYLAYLRQDKIFHRGEALTSKTFAELISRYFDSIHTIDPHLHRYKSLEEVYTIPGKDYTAMPYVQKWIEHNIQKPFLIGPDVESTPLIAAIASPLGCSYSVASKTRHGDRDVTIDLNTDAITSDQNIVIVDDIISSGITMLQVIDILRSKNINNHIVCVAVHGIFADDIYKEFLSKGVQVVTTNTIKHESNAIDISQIILASCLHLETN